MIGTMCWCDLLQEVMISGLPEIDFDDWKLNTEYSNYCDEPTIKVNELNTESIMMMNLL